MDTMVNLLAFCQFFLIACAGGYVIRDVGDSFDDDLTIRRLIKNGYMEGNFQFPGDI